MEINGRHAAKIQVLLWDVDGTLLDFHAAEQAAVRAVFAQFHLGTCTDTMLARYSAVNQAYWARLERGELTRQQVLVGRFAEFFAAEGLPVEIAAACNEAYQLALGDTIVYRDDSLQLVQTLCGKVRQYVVSNGTVAAQTRKLQRSGLGAYMDGIFLSEQVGAEKPNPAFFQKVFSEIGPIDPSAVLIIGDSLSSDICGGNQAGIRTCWYNPRHEAASGGYRIDYEISDLHEVWHLLTL